MVMVEWGNYRLRAMTEDDLKEVLNWRNSERIRSFMYTDHLISMEEHKKWFEGLTLNAGKKALIFEIGRNRSGVIHFSQKDDRTYEWGFYLGKSDLPRGTGLIMGVLALEYAFEQLAARKLYGEAFAFNQTSVSFHERLGFCKKGTLAKNKHGRPEDVVLFEFLYENWDGKDRYFQKSRGSV